nr:ribosome maturation factor RimP [Parvularcula dongshanensis]
MRCLDHRQHFEHHRRRPPGAAFFVKGPTFAVSTPQTERLEEIVEPTCEAAGFELVRLRVTGSKDKTLEIMAERPDGTMTAEDCAQLSRALSPVLDETDPIEGNYTLVVSSPGIDRPLTRLKDYERWEGFAAKIELTQAVENQKRFKGTLAGVEDGDVLFDIEGEEETAVIPYGLIASGKLVLTDELVTESLRRAKAAGRAPEGAPANDDA